MKQKQRADQLCGNHTADRRLCFRIAFVFANRFSHDMAHMSQISEGSGSIRNFFSLRFPEKFEIILCRSHLRHESYIMP